MTALRRAMRKKKIGKLRGVVRFLNGACQIPPVPSLSQKGTVPDDNKNKIQTNECNCKASVVGLGLFITLSVRLKVDELFGKHRESDISNLPSLGHTTGVVPTNS